MAADVRTVVEFTAAGFNTSVEHDYFINHGNYGDDLARFLMAELARLGIETDTGPFQEDFGWYFRFRADGHPLMFVLGSRDIDQTSWLGWIERDLGFVASVLGRRKRNIPEAGPRTIHRVLQSAPGISGILWHHQRDFDRNIEEHGAPRP